MQASISYPDTCLQRLILPGSDLFEGNQTLTLAILWQLMRSYTLSLLSRLGQDQEPINEEQIVNWIRSQGVIIKNFQDKSIRNSVPILKVDTRTINDYAG